MAPTNRVASRVPLKSVVKAGNEILISAATKTEKWWRTKEMAETAACGLDAAVLQRQRPLLVGTTEICLREGFHTSAKDARLHFTGICYAADGGEIGTYHFPSEHGQARDQAEAAGKENDKAAGAVALGSEAGGVGGSDNPGKPQ